MWLYYLVFDLLFFDQVARDMRYASGNAFYRKAILTDVS